MAIEAQEAAAKVRPETRTTQRTKAGLSFHDEVSIDQLEVLAQENKQLGQRERRYQETIRHLNNQIDVMKKSQVKLKRSSVKMVQ